MEKLSNKCATFFQNTNSGDHLKEMPRRLRDLSIQRARYLLTLAA